MKTFLFCHLAQRQLAEADAKGMSSTLNQAETETYRAVFLFYFEVQLKFPLLDIFLQQKKGKKLFLIHI